MLLRRILAALSPAPEPTTTLIPVTSLQEAVKGLSENNAHQDPALGVSLSKAYYDIGNAMEQYIGEGGAYERQKDADGRFILIRAIKAIANACGRAPADAREIEIDNDTLVDFRDTHFQIGLLPKPGEEDGKVILSPITNVFDTQALANVGAKAAELYEQLQAFSEQSNASLIPLLDKVNPNAHPQTFEDDTSPMGQPRKPEDDWFL